MNTTKELDNLFTRTFRRVIDEAKSGIAKGIPFKCPRLTKAINGVTRATYYLLLAASNVGKTRIAMGMFWLQALEYTFKNTDAGKPTENRVEGDVHVFFYSLEMTLARILAIVVARYLVLNKGHKDISDNEINGVEAIPEAELLAAMESIDVQKYLTRINKHTSFYMNNSPKDMLRNIDKYCKERSEIIDEDSEGKPIYRFKNPKFILIIILDHISNIGTASGDISRNAIKNLSNGLALLKNKYGITPVVLQQANPGEDADLIPTHKDVRDGKDTFIDADTVLGFGAPMKMNLTEVKHPTGKYYIIPSFDNQYRGLLNTIRFMGTEKVRYANLTGRAPFTFRGAIAEIEYMSDADKVKYPPYKPGEAPPKNTRTSKKTK